MYSPTCQYAIRALVHLARREGEGPALGRDIAAREEIPKSFLSKILHQLVVKGLVRSQKGPGGGFSLARPAAAITIADITEAVDGGPVATHRCLLGLAECSDATACALHESWKKLKQDYDRNIGPLTLADLARSATDSAPSGTDQTPSVG
jgi:Rrf2 family protein